MKVAFIVGQFPKLSETFILRQVTGLLERGHEVNVFAYDPSKDPLMHGDVAKYNLLEHTYYLSSYRSSSPSRIFRLIKRIGLFITSFRRNRSAVLKSLNVMKFGKKAVLLQVLGQIAPCLDKGPYDILHCQFGPSGEWGLLLREIGLCRGRLITSFYGADVSAYVKRKGDHVYANLFKNGDLFLCVSNRIKEKLVKLGCDEGKIVVHRSGVETKNIKWFPREARTDGRVTILTIARLVEKKGVEYGIRAVARLLQEFPHIEYKIAGDGRLRAKLEELIEGLKVRNHVKLLGWKSQEEIEELLRGSDILLAPSVTSEGGDEEGIPGVIMEAFALGLPVVSTYHAGIPEVVQDGESGFLVPERDEEALAQKLQYLIDGPELRCDMGRKGQKFVAEYYDIDKLNDRLTELYRQLLER